MAVKTVRELQQVEPVTIDYGRIRRDYRRPSQFALTGELGFRLHRAVHRIEHELPYSQEYILSQVNAAPGQWSNFPRFHGDIAGRWVLAETYTHSARPVPTHLQNVVASLITLQHDDGSFGRITTAEEPLNMHKIYGNGWMLKALSQYALTFDDEAVRQSAERLGCFYEQVFPLWSDARRANVETAFYAVSVSGYYHALDGLITLYDLTGDDRWLSLVERFLPDLISLAEADHSHMYLTIRRGLLRYYQHRGMTADIESLVEELHRCYHECLLETGGVPERFWLKPELWSDDEGCSLFDWSIITTHLYELTGDTTWLCYAILNLENHIFYNQTYNGGFGSYELQTGCYRPHGKEAPWCCSLFGPYGIIESAGAWVRLVDDVLEINHLISGEFTFASGDRITLSRDDEQGVFHMDMRHAPGVHRIALHRPFWLDITTSAAGEQTDANRFIIEVRQPDEICVNYAYKIWLSNKGRAPQRLRHMPADEPFIVFYGPWMLCHRFHGERAVVAHIRLDEAGFVTNGRHQFLLGIGFYGESYCVLLPCDDHMNPEDASRGVEEHSGEVHLYPLKAKESPGFGVPAVWGKLVR